MANRNTRNRNNKNSKLVSDRKPNQNGVKKRLGTTKNSRVADARQKIKMSNKRKNVVDARDILAKMAKTQDARGKLMKMREKTYNSPKSPHIRPIGAGIIRRTDSNGKICLQTTKSKMPSTMNLAIQQQLGIMPHSSSRLIPKKIPKKVMAPVPRSPPMRQLAPTVIRKTIQNNYSHPVQHIPQGYDFDDRSYNGASMYKWQRNEPTIPVPISAMRIDHRNLLSDATSGNWITYAPPMRAAPVPSTYIDVDTMMDDEEMPMATMMPRQSRMSSGIHARLDGSPAPLPPSSHGILSQTKTKVVVPVGHRIVVSNLQSTVTQDDIRELFEDIGQLLVARLVRPGTAEVIYKNLKDAQKAVDTYHNRQLDGQPMKCLLVNKRPTNNPTALAIHHAPSPSQRKLPAVNATNKLVPDISTIHKVLFQRN